MTTAWWSRLPARRPRPLHPPGRELSSPNPRSPSGFYLCPNWWMARRPTRDARETWRPGPCWRGRSEILLFPSLCAHGDWRSSISASQYWHVGRQWYPQGYWRYLSPASSFSFFFLQLLLAFIYGLYMLTYSVFHSLHRSHLRRLSHRLKLFPISTPLNFLTFGTNPKSDQSVTAHTLQTNIFGMH